MVGGKKCTVHTQNSRNYRQMNDGSSLLTYVFKLKKKVFNWSLSWILTHSWLFISKWCFILNMSCNTATSLVTLVPVTTFPGLPELPRSKGVFQLSSAHKSTKLCESFYYRAVVREQQWTCIQGFRTSSLQPILSCAPRFNSIIWNLSFPLNKHRPHSPTPTDGAGSPCFVMKVPRRLPLAH